MVAIFEADDEFEVVAVARDGLEAVEKATKLRPSVITMDIRMPNMDGLAATRRIMQSTPTPIVIVSGHVDVREVAVSMQALEAGALTLLPKPRGPDSPDFEASSRRMIATVKAMSQVKVVRRWRDPSRAPARPAAAAPPTPLQLPPLVIAIIASTGGPGALAELFSGLGQEFPVPIVAVQHVASDFAPGLVRWLDASVPLVVKPAEDGERLLPGHVYLATGDHHLAMAHRGGLTFEDSPPQNSVRPSGDVLFASVAEAYGARALAIALTGMGCDGVDGLRALREVNAHIIAQDEGSSLVFGIPKAAIDAGLVDIVLPLNAMAPYLLQVVQSA